MALPPTLALTRTQQNLRAAKNPLTEGLLTKLQALLFSDTEDDVDSRVAGKSVMVCSGEGVPTNSLGANVRGIYLREDAPDVNSLIYTCFNAAWSPVPVTAIAAALLTLARGRMIRGSATGVGEALDLHAAGAMAIGDGTDLVSVLVDMLPIADVGNYYTQVTLALMLQELFGSALGGVDSTHRAYSGGTLQEPADDATLTAALASLMLLRRDAQARLLLDEATPTSKAGRGLVVSGGVVTPQGAPDNTVAVASGVAYNQLGRRVLCTATPILAADTPNGLGGNRYDIVVIPAAGGAPVIRKGTIITTDPVLTAGDVPLYRLVCANGAFTIAGADITDIRQTKQTIPAAKLLPATSNDLLVFLDTDQITNAVLLKAVLDGAFVADAATRALFANLFLTDAKLAQDRGKIAGLWVGYTGGSTDITGGAANRDIKVNIDGAGDSNLTIAKAGLNTAPLIAAAIQAAIRAVGTGGYTLAECKYDTASKRYYVASGTRGSTSSVSISAGTTDDLAVSLKMLTLDNAVAIPGCDNADHARAQIAAVQAAGILSADAEGRLKMAQDFFDPATASNKFGNNALDSSFCNNKIANSAIGMQKLNTEVLAQSVVVTIPGGNGANSVGTLNATAIQIVPSPGPGKYIEIESAHVMLDWDGGAAYDSAAAGDVLTLAYTGIGGADLIKPLAGDVLGGAVADVHRNAPGIETVPVDNAPVMAYVKVGSWYAGAGSSPLKVQALYRTKSFAL